MAAFLSGVTVVIAAITAALYTGKDAHEDARKRYVAGIANGVFYLQGGCFAGTIILFFAALPKELIAVLAGAMQEIDHRLGHELLGPGICILERGVGSYRLPAATQTLVSACVVAIPLARPAGAQQHGNGTGGLAQSGQHGLLHGLGAAAVGLA